MNRKGEASIGGVVMMIILIVTCIALFGYIIDRQFEASQKQVIANESQSLTSCYADSGGDLEVNESNANCNITVDQWYSATDWRASDSQCAIGNVVYVNGTSGTLVLDTDYRVFATTGIIQLLNTSSTDDFDGNNSYLAYDFCGAGYNRDSGARGVSALWTIFAALALLSGVIFYGIKNYDWFQQ